METLKNWFLESQRDLPWRREKNPYRVWISEVMLQQTRASVVIPYFLRWMERFPTVDLLAESSIDEVIKLWEGLGYYSRARNLHEGAKFIVERFGGELPATFEELLSIKGIGRYTAGAILSFGFHKRASAIDGNVMRVLARYWGFDRDPRKAIVELEGRLQESLPEREPHIAMEALIELGALVCSKKPACERCPLQGGCVAKRENRVEQLPILTKKTKITDLFRFVACIISDDALLVRKGEAGKVMADLWEFPYVECDADPIFSEEQRKMEKWLGLHLELIAPLEKQKHHFTRFRSHLFPYLFEVKGDVKCPVGFSWVKRELLGEIPFSSGHRKIVSVVRKCQLHYM